VTQSLPPGVPICVFLMPAGPAFSVLFQVIAPFHPDGAWGQKCPADETYPNCVNGLSYLRDKDSLPTDSVQFALTETRISILDTTEPIPESVHSELLHRMWSKNGKLKTEIP